MDRTRTRRRRSNRNHPGCGWRITIKTARLKLPRGLLTDVALKRLEWALAILLSAVVLLLLIVRTLHIGALWRDECDSVQLAEMPRLSDLFANVHFTSFPVLFPLIIRGYTTVFGGSDFALRSFGLAVGVVFIGATWYFSLTTSRQPPLLLLGLIGLNTTFLIVGTWIRGYGIASVLLVVVTALAFSIMQEVTVRRLIVFFVGSLAASECLFFNGALLPAIVLPLAAILLLHRE